MDHLDDHMGPRYEDAFRQHLRRLAIVGDLGPKVVAVGPWWGTGGQDQIDAVVLSEADKRRVPVLAGEAKWARRINGARVKADLIRKAARLTSEAGYLRYCVCARDEVTGADSETLVLTAADIFGTDPPAPRDDLPDIQPAAGQAGPAATRAAEELDERARVMTQPLIDIALGRRPRWVQAASYGRRLFLPWRRSSLRRDLSQPRRSRRIAPAGSRPLGQSAEQPRM